MLISGALVNTYNPKYCEWYGPNLVLNHIPYRSVVICSDERIINRKQCVELTFLELLKLLKLKIMKFDCT